MNKLKIVLIALFALLVSKGIAQPVVGMTTFFTSTKTSIELFDVNGKKIIATEKEAGQWQLNINNQPTGIYFLKASQNGSTRIIKLIKE